MTDDLNRPYFDSPVGKALVWYCIYGDFPEKLVLDGKESKGMPEGVHAWRIPRDSRSFQGFFQDYIGTLLERKPGLAGIVRSAPEMLRISGEVEDQPDLGYLATVIEAVNAIGSSHGAGILDPQTFTWWGVEEWLERFQPFTFRAHSHVGILKSSESDENLWLHTRGMRKFARPDISISDVPEKDEDHAIEIINRFIEYQALGGVVQDGQEIRMRDVPPGMVCRPGGDLEDPDFNNLHIAILWPDQDT